jgi:hypothetical protein
MRRSNFDSPQLEIRHPVCRDCGVPMWLTRLELELTNPEREKRTFECKVCGGMLRDR